MAETTEITDMAAANERVNDGLFSFIAASPTAFHAVDTISARLRAEGFVQLQEGARWELAPGRDVFVTRNGSSVIALRIGEQVKDCSFRIVAAHSDSPTFKLKEMAELEVQDHHYTQLDTEGYGGMICASWFDRPLSIAGRVLLTDGGPKTVSETRLETRLVRFDRDLVLIPNVAIHFNRQVNDGYAYNRQVDLLPLFGGKGCGAGTLMRLLAEELGVAEEAILGSDLYLYDRAPGSVWGAGREFISVGRLDDLQCVYAGLEAFLAGRDPYGITVLAVFDNEEVGSGTKQGAGSTFLPDVLRRVSRALGFNEEDFSRGQASSFLLSADNAHAVHPNHPEKTDALNHVFMNEGVVLKSHAGQKYTSDALSAALVKTLAQRAGVPLQYFANRSDMAGGSTLGNIAMAQLSMNAADIGLPQLAMHSVRETAGAADTAYMIALMTEYYRTHLEAAADGQLRLVRAE